MSGQRSRTSRGGASDGGSGVVVGTDGVRVTKSLSDDAAAIPVIRYEIESSADSAVAVSLRDTMPEGIDADDVGFHADYEAERWQKTAGGVEFRCPLAPNDRVETVVGLRTSAVPEPAAFATEPELTVLATDGAGGSTSTAGPAERSPASGDGSSAVEEPSQTPDGQPADWERGMDLSDIERSFGGRQPDADGADDEGSDATGESDGDEPPTLDLDDPVGDSMGDTAGVATGGPSADDVSVDTSRGDESDDTDATAARADAAGGGDEVADRQLDPDDDVVAALVDAFRNDRVDEADRELLRNELNLELADSTSSFVEHLQSRAKRRRDQLTDELDDLEESITDLYGLKADASSVSALEDRVTDLRTTAAAAERVDALAESVRELDDRAADEAALTAVADRLDALADDAARADDLERVAEAARELEDRKAEADDVAALERSLESSVETARTELDGRIDEVVDAHATVSQLDELEGRLARLRERVDALDERAADAADLEDAEQRLDTAVSTLAEEVEALDDRTAEADDLASVEETLRTDYVTEADVESVVDSRLDQGVGRFLALALGSGALVSSASLALTAGATAAGVAVVLGLSLLGTWWYLGRQRTDPEQVGV